MVTNSPVSILFGDSDLAATRPRRVDVRRRGAVVNLAQTASELVRQATASPPDLLVLDEALKKDGDPDLLSFFADRHPETEVILLHSGGDATPHGLGLGL